MQTEGARRLLCVPGLDFGHHRIRGVDDESDGRCLRQQLVHQLQPFRPEFHVQLSCAGHVAAGPRQVGDEAEAYRIARGGKDNRDRCGRRFCSERRRRTCCGNHGDMTPYQIGSEFRQPIVMAVRPPVFDQDVLAFDEAHLVQTAAKFVRKSRVILRAGAVEEPDHRPGSLLRAGCKRPRGCRAADKGKEFASLHVPLQ